MEYFSLDKDAALTELEKECLSSGKSIVDIKSVMELVRGGSRPRRHVRNIIAASIFAMYRVNAAANMQVFEIRSLGTAIIMKESITPGNSYFKKSERQDILEDLHDFCRKISMLLDTSAPRSDELDSLRSSLAPITTMFDKTGKLSPEIASGLQSCVARTISLRPDDTGGFGIDVSGPTPELDFLASFSNLSLGTVPPKVVYQQVPEERFQEEAADIQMGDYADAKNLFFDLRRSDDVINSFGVVGRGTVGALLCIKTLPVQVINPPAAEVLTAAHVGYNLLEYLDVAKLQAERSKLDDEGSPIPQKLIDDIELQVKILEFAS